MFCIKALNNVKCGVFKTEETSLSTQCKICLTEVKMCQYIDANKIIQVLPQMYNCIDYDPH